MGSEEATCGVVCFESAVRDFLWLSKEIFDKVIEIIECFIVVGDFMYVIQGYYLCSSEHGSSGQAFKIFSITFSH